MSVAAGLPSRSGNEWANLRPFLPVSLAVDVEASGSSTMREWAASLPRRVDDLARRWSLQLSAPFQPGGSTAWVAPARDPHGRDTVLKVGWTHTEARDEAEGLAAFGGEGSVEVYAHEHDGSTTALLLERCDPGHELRTRPEPEQHLVIADLLHRLREVPLPASHRFRPLHEMCDGWAQQSAALHEKRPWILDSGLVHAGLELFRDLPRTATASALLCTDLHAGNVLAGTRRPWLLIDPKPYVGDSHYDVLQHLLNCQNSLQRDPHDLLQRMADLAGLDPDRVRHWLFARCVQGAANQPWLAAVAQRLAP